MSAPTSDARFDFDLDLRQTTRNISSAEVKAMLVPPTVRSFIRVYFTVCLGTLLTGVGALAADQATALPSPSELQKLVCEPTSRPDLLGVPSYAELKGTLASFRNYVRGSKLAAELEEPIVTRGGPGIAVYRRAAPAVVFVVAGNVQDDKVTDLAFGSGVIVNSAGYILTNWHVVAGFDGVVVFLKPAGSTAIVRTLGYGARPVNHDQLRDLALLKLENPPPNLPSIQVEASSKIQVAEDIHVIGHPGGPKNAWTYTTGVISQIRPDYEQNFEDGTVIRGNLIQIQTAVNPGNSGGPVLDDEANMVGLVSFQRTDAQNMNFAIGADEISAFLSRSMRMATRGPVSEAPSSPSVEYFSGRLFDGRQVIKERYTDMTVYLIREQSGRPICLIVESKKGVLLQASSPGPTGGFNKWVAKFSNGVSIEGTGTAGLPVVFVGE
jgi:S1-C subfamily serine protease